MRTTDLRPGRGQDLHVVARYENPLQLFCDQLVALRRRVQTVPSDTWNRLQAAARTRQQEVMDVDEHGAVSGGNRPNAAVQSRYESCRGGIALRRNGHQKNIQAGSANGPDHSIESRGSTAGACSRERVQVVGALHQQDHLRALCPELPVES